MRKACFFLLLLSTAAWAEDYVIKPVDRLSPPISRQDYEEGIVSQEMKIWALKRAYELNGNSMVGCRITSETDWVCHGMDVSAEVAAKLKPPEPVVVPSPIEKKKHK